MLELNTIYTHIKCFMYVSILCVIDSWLYNCQKYFKQRIYIKYTLYVNIYQNINTNMSLPQ